MPQRAGWEVATILAGGATMVIAWTGSTFEVIALALRAFALYYLLQCMVALSVCRNHLERVRFIFVAAALNFLFLYLLSRPDEGQ